jgi:nitrate/nitrite transport system ATP-binding protein
VTDTPGHDPRNVRVVRIGKPELMISSSEEQRRQASSAGLSRPLTSS